MGQSYTFEIADDPYTELFHTALKKYYYNRCGQTLSSELAGEAARNACSVPVMPEKHSSKTKPM